MKQSVLRHRRFRAQRSILAAYGVLVFVVSGVASGLGGYLSAATDAGVQSTIEAAASIETTFEVSAQDGSDPDTEHEAVSEHLADMLAGTPYEVHRSRASGPRWVYTGPDGALNDAAEDAAGEDAAAEDPGVSDGRLARGLVVAYDDLEAHAELVRGTWHSGASTTNGVPVTVHAAAAAELGIDVGDVLSVSDLGTPIALEVTGLYVPADSESAFWNDESREIEGLGASVGVVIALDDADIGAAQMSGATTRWRVAPDVSELRSADLGPLRKTLQRLQPRLESDARMAGTRVGVDTELATVLLESDARLRAARAVALVPLVLFGLVSVLALGVVARLLGVVRESDTALLRARGASAGEITRWSVLESALAALAPAVAGGALAWAALPRLPEIGAHVSASVVVSGALGAALLGIGTLTFIGARSAGAAVAATIERRAAAIRRRTVVRAGSSLLVFAMAGLTLWQLLRHGGPIVTDTEGMALIDPLAVAAPAALLLAGGMLGAGGVAAGAWVGSAIVARRRGLSAALTVRQVARRPAPNALPVVLLVLVAGGSTLAAGFGATWTGLQGDAAARRTGADVQVDLGPASPASVSVRPHGVDVTAYRGIDGVTAAEPVITVPRAGLSDGTVHLLAGSTGAAFPGIELPAGIDAFEIEVAAQVTAEQSQAVVESLELAPSNAGDPPAVPVAVRPWVADADGVVSLVDTARLEVPANGQRETYRVQAELPPGAGPWILAGFHVVVDPSATDQAQLWIYDVDAEVVEAHAEGGDVTLADVGQWAVLTMDTPELATDRFSVEQAASGPGVTVASGGLPWVGEVVARVVPAPDPSGLAVTATAAALDRFGLEVGDPAVISVFGADVPVTVAEGVEAIPGTTAAVAIRGDGTQLAAYVLASGGTVPVPGQVWLDLEPGAAADARLHEEIAAVAGDGAELLDRVALETEMRENVFAGLGLVTFWAATGASVLLAAAGLAAATAAITAQRSAEVAVLHSVGFSSAEQGRARRRELGLIAVLGIVIGTGVGVIVMNASAGLLAEAATPSPLENLSPALGVAVPPLAGLLAALLLAAVVVAVFAGLQVRRQASGSIREVGPLR